ncbi:hypothetical protein M8494_37450 [Serratia ureilytica]
MNFAMKLLSTAGRRVRRCHAAIHGLFGNLDNLGVLARDLHKQSHGDQGRSAQSASPRADDMNYPAMAQDLLALLDELQLEKGSSSAIRWAANGGADRHRARARRRA